MIEDDDKPITEKRLEIELERFRIKLQTEELAKQAQRLR